LERTAAQKRTPPSSQATTESQQVESSLTCLQSTKGYYAKLVLAMDQMTEHSSNQVPYTTKLSAG
jgi:hypothetical protein